MDDAVSRVGGVARIQTTPEIDQKKGGTSYRTWPVFSFALLALLALMLVPAVTALRRSEAIYDEVRATQQQFQSTQLIFEALSQNVVSISLAIREFLLDPSPDAGRIYRVRVNVARDQVQSDIARLGQVLPADGRAALQKLRQEVDDYLSAVSVIFNWTAEQRAERGAYFLREEQRPRRESVLAVARELSQINTAVYTQQQQRTTESEQGFRARLIDSVFFALVAGVIVSAGGILRMRWLERRAANERRRAEETTEEIRKLSARLRHAQEEERRTISRELHDEVGQKLTAMRMELGTLERLRGDEVEFDSRLRDVKGMAEQSLHSVRDIAAGLRPAVLDDLGLPAAVQKQAREFSRRTGVIVVVSVDGEFGGLPDTHRTYIYRIVQEALTNCAKHAHAHRITVGLLDHGDRVQVTIGDDGVGFATRPPQGLGLIGMEERIRELGGTIAIQSMPGRGTTIDASIPR
jgi:signal transduction histidine kinase